MFLATQVHENIDDLSEKALLRDTYITTLKEHREVTKLKTGRLYYLTLWSSLSPNGNIYRFNGLNAERMKHCEDLSGQLRVLADKHAGILGGPMRPRKERMEDLLHWLRHTEVQGSPEVEAGVATFGFKPLQEFLGSPVVSYGPFLMPADPEWCSEWKYAIASAYLVFVIQVFAPAVILMDKWNESGNRLHYFASALRSLSMGELFCWGKSLEDRLHTGMGGALLALLLVIIHAYIANERTNVAKAGRLPMDRYWYWMSSIANWWVTMALTFTAPVLFWSEDNATNIAMDSLTLLFVFVLDDLAGYATTFLGKTDEDFQRMTAWNFGLLSQCPVNLGDLVNEEATGPDDFWIIRYMEAPQIMIRHNSDSHGTPALHLLAAPRSGVASCPCEVRLKDATPEDFTHGRQRMGATTMPQPSGTDDERLPLLPASSAEPSSESSPEPTPRLMARDHNQDALRYRIEVSDREPIILPRAEAALLDWIWSILFNAHHFAVILFPIVWMLVNKPCQPHQPFERLPHN